MLKTLIAFYDVIYECRRHGFMMSSDLTHTLDDDKCNILGVYDFGDLLRYTIFPPTVPEEMNVLKYFPEAPLKLVKDRSLRNRTVRQENSNQSDSPYGFQPRFPGASSERSCSGHKSMLFRKVLQKSREQTY